jgi:hypothetical protein
LTTTIVTAVKVADRDLVGEAEAELAEVAGAVSTSYPRVAVVVATSSVARKVKRDVAARRRAVDLARAEALADRVVPHRKLANVTEQVI